MRVLIACEFSGIVRNAFRKKGHDCWSCDLIDSEDHSEFHFKCDVRTIFKMGWDLMICHPPCTHLCVSGAKHFASKLASGVQDKALYFVADLMNSGIKKIAVENPIGVISTRIRKPDQIIQPWQFGHGETKATCLWLKNLPLLKATKIVNERKDRIHRMPPSPDRWKQRSRTYMGIANAMAEQWGR